MAEDVGMLTEVLEYPRKERDSKERETWQWISLPSLTLVAVKSKRADTLKLHVSRPLL
jgi:hypothetical protein